MKTTENNPNLLKDFMEEFFDFKSLKKIGLFKKDIKKDDYEAQAARICQYFGMESIYEWRKDEIRCHISEVNPNPTDPFVTVLPSIYE
jgi:hypothetical protein